MIGGVLGMIAAVWSGAGLHVFPGAVATADHSTGYIANPAGGIDAIRLDTGQPVWSTNLATWPLELLGDRLVAAAPVAGDAHAFQIDCLNASTGSVLLQSDAIDLPNWVTPTLSYDEQPHYRFDLSSEAFDNHFVLLRWCARNWDGSASGRAKASGAFQIDTQTGQMSTPFLDAQPHFYQRNLLYDRRPDPTQTGGYVLGPELTTDQYTFYLSETVPTPDAGKHPIRLVATDPDTGKVLWQKAIGTRSTLPNSGGNSSSSP